MEENNFDDFLSQFGNPGRHQTLCGLVLVLTYTQWTFGNQFAIIMSYVPRHHCQIPKYLNLTTDDVIPPEDQQCSRYANPLTYNWSIIPCIFGWDYTTLRGEIYLANDFDLVCDRQYLLSLTLSAHLLGLLFGGAIFGSLADRLGRQTILKIISPTVTVLTIACSFSPNIFIVIAYRFVISVFTLGIQTICITYSAELFRRRIRTYVNLLFSFVSACTLPFQMYAIFFLLNWRVEQLLISFLSMPVIILIWCLPETLPWLLSKGKIDEADRILQKIAKFNNIPYSRDNNVKELRHHSQRILQNVNKSSESSFTRVKKLFSNAVLRRTTLSFIFIKFTSFSTFLLLSFSISLLNGNMYTNFLINFGFVILMIAIATFTFSTFGRIKILFIHFLLTGLLAIGGIILTYYNDGNNLLQTLATGMALISRCLLHVTVALVMTICSELFPTPLRATALGFITACGLIGSVLMPEFLSTNQIWKPLPLTVFGILCVVSAIVIKTLPETFHKKMPNSIEDVEMLWKREDQNQNENLDLLPLVSRK